MVSYCHRPQDNILVDKSGFARLNDFGFTAIGSLNCSETSAAGFKRSHRWMAPEFFKTDDSDLSTNASRPGPSTNAPRSGLSTNASDVFALGMVTFEVCNIRHESPFYGARHLVTTTL